MAFPVTSITIGAQDASSLRSGQCPMQSHCLHASIMVLPSLHENFAELHCFITQTPVKNKNIKTVISYITLRQTELCTKFPRRPIDVFLNVHELTSKNTTLNDVIVNLRVQSDCEQPLFCSKIVETNEHFKIAETADRKYASVCWSEKRNCSGFILRFGTPVTDLIIPSVMPIWKIFSREWALAENL